MKQDKMQELEKIILRDYGNIAGMMVLKNGKTLYDFSTLALFWVGTGLGSALLCFTTAAIVARRHAVERQTSFSS